MAALTVIAVIYIGFALFFESHFSFGTKIDGISVGGRSAAGVEKLIDQEIREYALALSGREGASGTIAGSSIALAPVFQGEVAGLLEEQKGYEWIVTLFREKSWNWRNRFLLTGRRLRRRSQGLRFMNGEQRDPSDASYSEYDSEAGYTLVPADYGTKIDEEAFYQAVVDAVSGLDETLDLLRGALLRGACRRR